MNEPLDELYSIWLTSQVSNVRLKNPSRTYWSVMRQLHTKPFVWFVPNDDNREHDGLYLRDEFSAFHTEIQIDRYWYDLECSMLEMLIGLSRRLSFESDGEPREWFWCMLENIGLTTWCADKHYNREIAERIDETLERVIWRTYSPNGCGGLFPLQRADRDQRQVELWYQLNAYLMERD